LEETDIFMIAIKCMYASSVDFYAERYLTPADVDWVIPLRPIAHHRSHGGKDEGTYVQGIVNIENMEILLPQRFL
jgi:hypothetical protein